MDFFPNYEYNIFRIIYIILSLNCRHSITGHLCHEVASHVNKTTIVVFYAFIVRIKILLLTLIVSSYWLRLV